MSRPTIEDLKAALEDAKADMVAKKQAAAEAEKAYLEAHARIDTFNYKLRKALSGSKSREDYMLRAVPGVSKPAGWK